MHPWEPYDTTIYSSHARRVSYGPSEVNRTDLASRVEGIVCEVYPGTILKFKGKIVQSDATSDSCLI